MIDTGDLAVADDLVLVHRRHHRGSLGFGPDLPLAPFTGSSGDAAHGSVTV